WGTADLIADGDYVVGRWEGGGTHTGVEFDDLPIGSLAAGSGKSMRFSGTTVLRLENGLITEEVGLDDDVAVLRQLGIIPASMKWVARAECGRVRRCCRRTRHAFG